MCERVRNTSTNQTDLIVTTETFLIKLSSIQKHPDEIIFCKQHLPCVFPEEEKNNNHTGLEQHEVMRK